ncbi:MAG TPA: hypothetical protein VGG72_13370 [Bryobacteraceae bacterium]
MLTKIFGTRGQGGPAVVAVACCALAVALGAVLTTPTKMYAQGKGGGKAGGKAGAKGTAPAAPQNAKASAPIDLTGYWVSVVTEDWRYRMVVPSKGDFQGVPMTPAARTVANAWDPDKEAPGDQCKAYGAPALLREPTRLHITWADDNTLKIDSDAGKQTRLFHFGEWTSPGGPPTIQGDSVASWSGGGGGRGGRGGGGRGGAGAAPAPIGPRPPADASLNVTTTNIKAGYLRKNGIPYSDKTTLTEYFDLMNEPTGDPMFVVTVITSDPMYLTRNFVITSQFKKEPGETNAKWKPTDCSAKW